MFRLMKAINKLCFAITILFTTTSLIYSQTVSSGTVRKVLFSIGKDEKPVFNESSITLSPIGTSVIVLTSDEEGRIFVYENGKRKGPFNDVIGTGITRPEDSTEEYDPIFRKESDPDYEKYIGYNDAGQVTLKFGEKTFGPFQFILEFYSSNDKTAFSAIVMKDGKPQIITWSGNKIEIDGQPGYNYISPSGKKMLVTTVKENNEAGDLMKRDLSDMSPEEITKLGKEIEAKKSTKPPEAYIYFQDGKKFGPYDPKKINAFNPAFSKTGEENWLLTIDSKLFINGTLVKDLRNEHISPANIWLTGDGKRFAILVYNRIEFSDGSVYRDPLKVRIAIKQNKITFWWLLFENEKDIVLYSKTL
jgi:hypothetical protein